MALNANHLRVRMYRVGFGECFLVSLPVDGGHRHLLIDCGVHPMADLRTLPAVLQDVAAECGQRLDLVVATHEHADHISGFGSQASAFEALGLGEIWMPWALDPEDRQAAQLREDRLSLLAALGAHFDAVGGSASARAALVNLRGNDLAVHALRSGFGGRAAAVRYPSAGERLTLPGIPGLHVRVLAPPRDEAFLRQMQPPRSQRFLRASGGAAVPANPVEPFARKWRLRPVAGRQTYGFTAREERQLRGLGDAAEELALAMSRIVNNTSLVLLLEHRGRNLLFTGDAQWGNWRSWIEGPSAEALLESISFLKVAHHGSHNATPKSALEAMDRRRLVAMVSTQSRPWASIPQTRLMQALATQTRRRVARSDAIAVQGAPTPPAGQRTLPRAFRHQAGDLWADWRIRV
jgi:beta-lactamase superfamily II metal-dependent hydrolase